MAATYITRGPLRYVWIIMLFASPRSMYAQKSVSHPHKGPVPSWVKPYHYDAKLSSVKKNIEGGEYLELYEKQRNLAKEAVYFKFVRRITSETGVQNASEISVLYDPSYQRLTFHSIRVMRQGKIIDQLNLSKIKLIRNETDLDRFVYSGMYTAYLTLDDIRPGDRILYSYTLSGMNPVFDHHFGDILYFNSSNPVSHLFIRLITAPGQPLYFHYFNKAPKPNQSTWNGKTVYEWHMSNRPAYISEANEPSWYYGAAYVQITSDSSWKNVANWAVNNMKKRTTSTSPLIKKKVSEWTKQSGDDIFNYIRLATRFVQDQIRYMGVEMGPYSQRPHEPSQVMRQRYGDCKDKSLLLCTLLRKRNIDAHVAFVSTDRGHNLSQYLPSVNLFDHAIVTYNLYKYTYWIDPTISYQRGKIWNTVTPDYGYALIISQDDDSLSRMNVLKTSTTHVVERFILPKNNNGVGLLDVTTTYSQGDADNTRQFFSEYSLSDIQKDYLDYYTQLYNNVTIVDSLTYSDDAKKNQIRVIEKYRIKNPWILADSAKQLDVFQAYAKILQDHLPNTVSVDRKSPLSLGSPVNLSYKMQLILPIKLPIKRKYKEIKRDAYDYTFDNFGKGNTVNLEYTYQILKNYIPPKSFETFNTDMFNIKNELGYGVKLFGAVLEARNKISWFSIILALISIVLISIFAVKAYRFSLSVTQDHQPEVRTIGGLLILVAIGLCISPFQIFYFIISHKFFSQSIWIGAKMHTGLTFWLTADLVIDMFFFVGTILLLFLFFKRRDTFPKAFILYFGLIIGFQFIDYWVTKDYGLSTTVTIENLARSILLGFIWIPYFLISKRVKETFVYPYPKEQSVVPEVAGKKEGLDTDAEFS